jgi:cytochrome c553
MNQHPRKMLAAALVLAATAVDSQAADGDPAVGEAIADKICSLCHGDSGNSTDATYPRLAGQTHAYTSKQLKDYFAGKRENAKMLPYLARFKPSDIPDLAAYYAQQATEPVDVQDPKLAAAGKRLFQQGDSARGVPACVACHEAGAKGDGRYPKLAPQHQDYTQLQLQRFGSGERNNDKGRVMRNVAAKLSAEDIAALAEYLAAP